MPPLQLPEVLNAKALVVCPEREIPLPNERDNLGRPHPTHLAGLVPIVQKRYDRAIGGSVLIRSEVTDLVNLLEASQSFREAPLRRQGPFQGGGMSVSEFGCYPVMRNGNTPEYSNMAHGYDNRPRPRSARAPWANAVRDAREPSEK